MSQRGGSPIRLSFMMFLQYAVWGVWLPYLANYLTGDVAAGGLGFTGAQVGWILGLAGSIGAVTAPFLAGQIADRFINAEIYLGLLLIAGGIVKFVTYYVHDYQTFLYLSIAYSIVYMPTLALTNSIAFAHLADPERSFPKVRVWGTIGWIIASSAFPLIWLQTNLEFTWLPPFLDGEEKTNAVALFGDCLRVSGVISILYGAWAIFVLPRTPPRRDAPEPLAFLKAFSMLKQLNVAMCMLAALGIAMIHQVYFIRTGPFLVDLGFQQAHVGPVMTIGQFAEIIVLALLGLFLTRLNYKWTLMFGCLAFSVRYALFAEASWDSRWMIFVGMALHGFCYAFFFAASFIFIERVAAPDIRHSAQTVYGIVILGVGPVLAGFYNEWLDAVGGANNPDPFDWNSLWWVQSAVGLAMAGVILIGFWPKIRADKSPIGDR